MIEQEILLIIDGGKRSSPSCLHRGPVPKLSKRLTVVVVRVLSSVLHTVGGSEGIKMRESETKYLIV